MSWKDNITGVLLEGYSRKFLESDHSVKSVELEDNFVIVCQDEEHSNMAIPLSNIAELRFEE